MGADDLHVAVGVHPEDAAAAAVEVAVDLAHVGLGDPDLDRHDRLEQRRLGVVDAVLERHRRRDLERHLVRVDRVERPVVERRPEVGQRIAGDDTALGRLADALLDAGEEALRHGAADDTLGELDAAIGVGLELQPDVPEHPVPAGLLLVAAVDLGLAADRLLVRDLGRVGHDRRPELALEPLDDDRGVGLAHRPQDLLAGGGALQADGRLLLEHAGQRRAHLVEVALALRLDGDHQRRLGEVERRQDQRLLARCQRVAGLGHGQLRDRADLAGLELADRLLLLAVEQQQLADPLVLAPAAVPDVGLRMERPGQDAQVGQPPDERVGGRLEDADEERAVLVGGDLDLARLVGRPSPAPRRRGRGGSGRSRRAGRAGRCP